MHRGARISAGVAAIVAAGSVLMMVAAEPLLAQTSQMPTSPAQIWPTKRVQVVVPFSPGSATDLLPRTVFEHVSAKVGQPIIIENRPGGGGAIGVSSVAKADPDGHTILVHSNALVTAPAIQNMPYDPVRDFAGITPLGNVPLVLVISPDKNIKTLKELVAAAKAKSGSINYAAAGIGTPPHLTTERFRLAAKFEGQLVPFKGAPEALTEVITGRVDFYFCPITPAMPFIREGKLLALAVSSSKRRPRCRTCRPPWRRVSPIPISISGSECSCRRRPRATSSLAFTRRRWQGCRTPTSRRSCPSSASSR